MITLRRSQERGHLNHGWLDTYHTFSFGNYYDPEHMHFRALRVINEDRVAGGEGFGEHPHDNMEIITYVLSGALEHRDSMGSHGIIAPGDVQRMSAGTGILHSEFNASTSEPVHLLQIWLMPKKRGVTPTYEQKHFAELTGWQLLVTPEPQNGELKINQDAKLFRARMNAGESLVTPLDASRFGFLQVAKGRVTLAEARLEQGDGAQISGESNPKLHADSEAEVLFFDLA